MTSTSSGTEDDSLRPEETLYTPPLLSKTNGWERDPLACTLRLVPRWCQFVHIRGVSQEKNNTAASHCGHKASTQTLFICSFASSPKGVRTVRWWRSGQFIFSSDSFLKSWEIDESKCFTKTSSIMFAEIYLFQHKTDWNDFCVSVWCFYVCHGNFKTRVKG